MVLQYVRRVRGSIDLGTHLQREGHRAAGLGVGGAEVAAAPGERVALPGVDADMYERREV